MSTKKTNKPAKAKSPVKGKTVIPAAVISSKVNPVKAVFNAARLGEKMVEKRTKDNLTQKACSDITGIPQSQFYALEAGTTPNPSVTVVFKICSWLGYDIKSFF